MEFACLSGVTATAAAFACTINTAVAHSVFGANHRPVDQHAGTGLRAASSKPATWAPEVASHLTLEFALLAAPLDFGVFFVQTAVEAFALETPAVVIANLSLGPSDDDGARDGASGAIVLGMATVANFTCPVPAVRVRKTGA